ncbi:MAG: sulfotransferase [Chloroflexi bacterium]|nr:sulfotransferase [Chloroflexota bacterium]
MIERQIFIGGCSRSGTTLLGSMLGGHSRAISTPESHFKQTALRSLGGNLNAFDVDEAYARIKDSFRFKIWEVDPPPLPDHITSYAGLLNWLAALYARQVGKDQAEIWVDHTPENATYATMLFELFPQAKLLHIVRDGRGVAASIMPLDWGPNTILRAAHWWVEYVSYGLALEHTYPERVLRVHYEGLVTDPQSTLQAICQFAELDLQPAMLEAAGFQVPAYTASQHELVGQKPDPSRATRWEKRLTQREIELFEYATRDYLGYLGYPLRFGWQAQAASPVETAGLALREAYRFAFANRVRWLRRGARVMLPAGSRKES